MFPVEDHARSRALPALQTSGKVCVTVARDLLEHNLLSFEVLDASWTFQQETNASLLCFQHRPLSFPPSMSPCRKCCKITTLSEHTNVFDKMFCQTRIENTNVEDQILYRPFTLRIKALCCVLHSIRCTKTHVLFATCLWTGECVREISKNVATNSPVVLFFSPVIALVRQCHIRRSLRFLSNQSCLDKSVFCITLVRKKPQRVPIGVSPCSFTVPRRFPNALFLHIILKEAMHLSHCRSEFNRDRSFLRGMVLPL